MSFTVRKIEQRSAKSKRALWTARIATLLSLAQPLTRLYLSWKERHESEQRHKRRVQLLKKSLLVLIAVFFALLLLASIAKALMSVRGISMESVIGMAGAELQTDNRGHTNVLLLGQGNEEHAGTDLTDTIMVANIDPETRSAFLLSLPRDLYFLSTEKMGKGKVNSFYRDYKGYLQYRKGMPEEDASNEALEELADEIGRKLNMPIHYAAKVNFNGFVKAVDALGGVTVDVPQDIEDDQYPDGQGGYETFTIRAGPRQIDGETALKYARSRHTTSDFDRSARQQQLLKALAKKAREEGVLTDTSAITSLMKILSENVETTMSIREIISAARLARSIEFDRVVTMQLNNRNGLYDNPVEPGGFLYAPPRNLFDGASVLLPVSIPEFPVTWKQPRALVRLLRDHRSVYLENPSIAVLNAGAPPLSATKLGTELTRYGFAVEEIANAEGADREETLITTPAQHPADSAQLFGQLLEAPVQEPPDDLPADQLKNVTILQGANFEYTPLQDLVPNLSEPDTSSVPAGS